LHIYHGDVHAGTITIRTGNPHDEDPWEWHCSFYPGSESGEQQNGTAATLDEARADFECAWRVFLSRRSDADFPAWRDQRDWTARKYALWGAGKRLPPNESKLGKPCSIYLKCPCGNSHRLEETWCTFLTSRTSARIAPRKTTGWKRPFDDPIPLPAVASSSLSRAPPVTSSSCPKPSRISASGARRSSA
jgi:hypothetical protein